MGLRIGRWRRHGGNRRLVVSRARRLCPLARGSRRVRELATTAATTAAAADNDDSGCRLLCPPAAMPLCHATSRHARGRVPRSLMCLALPLPQLQVFLAAPQPSLGRCLANDAGKPEVGPRGGPVSCHVRGCGQNCQLPAARTRRTFNFSCRMRRSRRFADACRCRRRCHRCRRRRRWLPPARRPPDAAAAAARSLPPLPRCCCRCCCWLPRSRACSLSTFGLAALLCSFSSWFIAPPGTNDKQVTRRGGKATNKQRNPKVCGDPCVRGWARVRPFQGG